MYYFLNLNQRLASTAFAFSVRDPAVLRSDPIAATVWFPNLIVLSKATLVDIWICKFRSLTKFKRWLQREMIVVQPLVCAFRHLRVPNSFLPLFISILVGEVVPLLHSLFEPVGLSNKNILISLDIPNHYMYWVRHLFCITKQFLPASLYENIVLIYIDSSYVLPCNMDSCLISFK